MKQYITKKQWNELSQEQKWEFIAVTGEYGEQIVKKVKSNIDPPLLKSLVEHWEEKMFCVNIGAMIEFLGDDYIEILYKVEIGRLINNVKPKDVCNALWSACKEKLNN